MQRLNSAPADDILVFFKFHKDHLLNLIPPEQKYNMDETRLAMGTQVNCLVVRSSKKQAALKTKVMKAHWGIGCGVYCVVDQL